MGFHFISCVVTLEREFLKVSKVKDLTKSMSCSMIPSCSSSWGFRGLGLCRVLFLVMRQNHHVIVMSLKLTQEQVMSLMIDQ